LLSLSSSRLRKNLEEAQVKWGLRRELKLQVERQDPCLVFRHSAVNRACVVLPAFFAIAVDDEQSSNRWLPGQGKKMQMRKLNLKTGD
jgi:hypothetical protein